MLEKNKKKNLRSFIESETIAPFDCRGKKEKIGIGCISGFLRLLCPFMTEISH